VLSVTETQTLEYNGWIVRLQAAQAQPARWMLMLHGWTGDEHSMWVFASRTSPRHYLVAPRAPYPTQPSGYSWRPLLERRGWPRLEDLQPAAEKLLQLIESLSAELRIPTAPLDLMGFSQGAATAAVFLTLFPEKLERVALLSGFLPQGCETRLEPGRLSGKKVFIAHGSQDKMVPYAWGEAMAETLRAAGAEVTFCMEEVGHKVGARCAAALQRFFSDPEPESGEPA
jgi:phospholipase/carboxylesterase